MSGKSIEARTNLYEVNVVLVAVFIRDPAVVEIETHLSIVVSGSFNLAEFVPIADLLTDYLTNTSKWFIFIKVVCQALVD